MLNAFTDNADVQKLSDFAYSQRIVPDCFSHPGLPATMNQDKHQRDTDGNFGFTFAFLWFFNVCRKTNNSLGSVQISMLLPTGHRPFRFKSSEVAACELAIVRFAAKKAISTADTGQFPVDSGSLRYADQWFSDPGNCQPRMIALADFLSTIVAKR